MFKIIVIGKVIDKVLGASTSGNIRNNLVNIGGSLSRDSQKLKKNRNNCKLNVFRAIRALLVGEGC
jgi:hypothetical protein